MSRRAWRIVELGVFVSAAFACGRVIDQASEPDYEFLPSPHDASVVDVARVLDANRPDVGNEPEPGWNGMPPCGTPADMSSFSPSWKPPNPLGSGQCSAVQAETCVRCQLDTNADQAACKAFVADKANADCAKCIFTPSSATKLGPVIELPGNLVKLNTEGCIANASGDITANGCAALVQAAQQCGEAACESNSPCPSGDQDALAALGDCEQRALDAGCKRFATNCAEPLLADGGVAEQCARTGDFVVDAVHLAKLFCVAPIDLDAGDGG